MTIKQQGGIFGRNPTFNDLTVEGTLTQSSGTTNLVDVEAAKVNVDTTTDNEVIGQFALWDSTQGAQAYLRMAHSLGTSVGSHDAITVNDALGAVTFAGSTGTAFYDGASVEGKATQTYTASNGGTKLLFKTTPNGGQTLTEQMSLDQDGTLTVANGDIVIGTSGKGIDFSATSGTGTSELFSDYEEGSFTPTLTTDGTDFSSVTYDAAVFGSYTKVGNVVHIQLFMQTDAVTKGSASGNVIIGGLPFTADGTAPLAVATSKDWLADHPTRAYVADGATTISLLTNANNTADDENIVVADVKTLGNDNTLRLAGTYRAS